ncbi:S1C family serine protease [Urechidicola vernalis]|uniref:Trypsin-like peptidase domain-containing protein n=1 Tax=Urechidicola vernalis TaxID=3075600 RepID=A0ABU2Y6X1_9FLAO|nr:trypsin-like peptidase domain-containing protein [Urechidicola sp. P050]MDT0553442.1 trypsin-like peptidase domain-containing protein [Urechidicola sp. P050]
MKKITILFIAFLIGTHTYSQSLTELYDLVHSSVVVIKTISSESAGLGDKQKVKTSEGLGSGVLVSYNGLIWTASHVVHNAEKVMVKFPDGDVYEADVLSSSPMADVALIKINSLFDLKKKHIAQIGNSDDVKIGEDVFVIGTPLGIEQTLSRGIVSGKMAKEGLNDDFLPVEFIQTDAAINPGNSGGPMFNMNGEVIAIASFIMSQSGGFDGIGFGASSNVAQKILMDQPNIWSGMEFVLLQNELADIFNIPQDAGVLVQTVASKGLGDKLGLTGGYINATIEGKPLLVGGDILLEIAGVKLDSEEAIISLREKIVTLQEGGSYTVKYLRAGKIITKEVSN